MSRDAICPLCGATQSATGRSAHVLDLEAIGLANTVETLIPDTSCVDEQVLSLSSASESIETYAAAPAPGLEVHEASEWLRHDVSHHGSSEFDAVASAPPDPLLESLATRPFEDREPRELVMGSNEMFAPPVPSPDDSVQGTRSWPHLLLASYASAVTIALAFMMWKEARRSPPVIDTLPRASRSGRATTSPPRDLPIGPRWKTTVGQPLGIGALEITPLSVGWETVHLANHIEGGEFRDATGGSAIVLHLKVRNTSTDLTFAPFDRAFLRDSETDVSATYLEDGTHRIGTYPLALASELGIEGQRFETLPPGSSFETIVVSDKNPNLGAASTMTWRIKIRVALDEVAMFGVEFRPDQIH